MKDPTTMRPEEDRPLILDFASWRFHHLKNVGVNPGEEALREAWILYCENDRISLAVRCYERGQSYRALNEGSPFTPTPKEPRE